MEVPVGQQVRSCRSCYLLASWIGASLVSTWMWTVPRSMPRSSLLRELLMDSWQALRTQTMIAVTMMPKTVLLKLTVRMESSRSADPTWAGEKAVSWTRLWSHESTGEQESLLRSLYPGRKTFGVSVPTL